MTDSFVAIEVEGKSGVGRGRPEPPFRADVLVSPRHQASQVLDHLLEQASRRRVERVPVGSAVARLGSARLGLDDLGPELTYHVRRDDVVEGGYRR